MNPAPQEASDLTRYLSLKLATLGHPVPAGTSRTDFLEIARPLLRNYAHREWLMRDHLCPADARVQGFLDAYLQDACPDGAPRLPGSTLTLDVEGLARLLSLPPSRDSYASPYLNSYRVLQGVVHNPHQDRRTTKGVFHIVEGGFPIPADKLAVPQTTFAALLQRALDPPPEAMVLPYTADQDEPARAFVSLLLRPLVCPATGTDPAKSMEVRFLAPGSLVSNLDFVESIFGNGGDPHLPENDAALDVLHWTGHTGCVILAPHLVGLKKSELGLPRVSKASERQRREGMCWENEDEPYNGGNAFKICCRDHRGVTVTIIADSYYGYCKKEVKTLISYAANLFGLAEEEHAGGALAFTNYILGQDFDAAQTVSLKKATFEQAMSLLGDLVDRRPERYAVDRKFSDVYYLPEDAVFSVRDGLVRWEAEGAVHTLPLRPSSCFILPSGFRVRLEKQVHGSAWRLIGSRPRSTFCHKPCTVSGGGKSEISKSIANALIQGPVFVGDFRRDIDCVDEILRRDYADIYKDRSPDARTRRSILSGERSLGSVIKLLSPSPEYRDDYNQWVSALAPTVRQLVFTVKRYHQPHWSPDWREHFSVDRINGVLGHELKYDGQKLVANYLRVGYDDEASWRIFKLRPDFYPAEKIQMEDDITASVVLPRRRLSHLDPLYDAPSVKLVANCEKRLFQRPDDAIIRGADLQAEADLASSGSFLANYEPLDADQARAILDHTAEFDRFTEPMKRVFENFLSNGGPKFVASSAHPRLVDGKPSTNPRYLQDRPDLAAPRARHLAEMTARLHRDIPARRPVRFPVDAVLAGRRNSPPDPKLGIPPLAVYGPIHYQELPELFMEFISSLTGKSPATTGFGSEGALTKGPFNALWPVVDLNNALVAMILTGYAGFTTSAGYIGPRFRVDHDVSLLVPEIWCRMRVEERHPRALIEGGFLELVPDFEFEGSTIPSGRLGYRITPFFVDRYLGRVFERPDAVFPVEMLRPELQDFGMFVEGVRAIAETQQRVARLYFDDGSVEAACPPLKALLHIMANGSWEGKDARSPEVRALFSREALLASAWYRERLETKQERDVALWRRHLDSLLRFSAEAPAQSREIDLEALLTAARGQLARVQSPSYIDELTGTIGADPFHLQMP